MLKTDLQNGLLFARLDDEQLERVAQHAVRAHLNEGQMLFRQHEPADRFYLLLAGQIKLFLLGPSGNEKVIEVVTPGSTFAEALMFLDRPVYPVGAQALQTAEIISIDAADFASMLRESIDTCFMLMGDMSQRLRSLIVEIDDLSLNSASCRVAGYLLSRARTASDSFDLDIPKQTLASRLSVQPETFSRIMRSLSDKGLIAVTGAHVVVRDRRRLEQLASSVSPGHDSSAAVSRDARPAAG